MTDFNALPLAEKKKQAYGWGAWPQLIKGETL